jgi:hypothetical protein
MMLYRQSNAFRDVDWESRKNRFAFSCITKGILEPHVNKAAGFALDHLGLNA